MPTRRPFAQGTAVAESTSRIEIETLLRKHGATSIASGWDGTRATVLFEAHSRRVRFNLDLQAPSTGKAIAENRRRWRCLLLILKAKLEAVAGELVTFEEEFLAQTVLPNGETVGDWMAPQVAAAYERGAGMPKLLGVGS